MEEVDEGGAAEERLSHLRLRPEGLERHHVLQRRNCRCFTCGSEEATFNHGLKVIFIVTLTLGLTSIILFTQGLFHQRYPDNPETWDDIFNRTWLFGCFPIGPKGVVMLFAVVLVVAVFVPNPLKKWRRSAAPRRETVQTVSALLQQV